MSMTIKMGLQQQNNGVTEKHTIFAGNNIQNNNQVNPLLAAKKGLAQKQAMKLINDAWDKDKSLSNSITDLEAERTEKLAELNELQARKKTVLDKKAALQEEYGVASDSQEQKDLELLEKYQNYTGGSNLESFSKEDIERLKELQDIPRTDYQNRALAANASMGTIDFEMERKQNEIIGVGQSISDVKSAQLKSQNMQKATDAADAIMEASSKEILGMLVEDGVQSIDKKAEEIQKDAEEASEKKEEQEEKQDKIKEDRKQQEELLKNVNEAETTANKAVLKQDKVTTISEAQKDIQKILQENNLINEDLKGIKIDFNF